MLRILGSLAALTAAWLVWRLPEQDPVRLAALDAERVLEQPTTPGGSKLVDEVLADARARAPGDPDHCVVSLFGVKMSTTHYSSDDANVHFAARTSIVRGLRAAAQARGVNLEIQGEKIPQAQGWANFEVTVEEASLRIDYTGGSAPRTATLDPWQPVSRLSLLPPLVAIALAMLTRRAVIPLLCGVLCAAFLLHFQRGESWLPGAAHSLSAFATELFLPRLLDREKACTVLFVIAMLALVGVVARSGGLQGWMNLIGRPVRSARGSQLTAYGMGLGLFLDDRSSAMVVGSTMRPLTDRFRVSREKLAYIVDSTSAPVAGLAAVSTWIAFEISCFGAQLPSASLEPIDGYRVLLQSLPYRFYCILTLFMVPVIALGGRDFGPMLRAERRARSTGDLVRAGAVPLMGAKATTLDAPPGVAPKASRAILPFALFLGLSLLEVLRRGGAFARPLSELLSARELPLVLFQGSGASALLAGASAALMLAVLMAFAAGLRHEILHGAWTAVRSALLAIGILYLAWMIALACDKLGTASYLRGLLGDQLHASYLPSVLFLFACAISFATGSSFCTMAVLLPMVVGLAQDLGTRSSLGGSTALLMSIAAVLEGSIFGGHCSPISETTVLSSTFSASDHMDHVNTQAPYSILTMLVALVAGYAPCGILGWSPWICLPLSAVLLFFLVRGLGKRSDEPLPLMTSGLEPLKVSDVDI